MWDFSQLASALGYPKLFVLLGGMIGVVGAISTIFDFKWALYRRHGFTYEVLRLGISIAVFVAVIQAAALITELLADVDLIWAATALTTLIVAVATVLAYHELKERQTFRLHKLILMFAMPLSPVGASYALQLLRRTGWLASMFP